MGRMLKCQRRRLWTSPVKGVNVCKRQCYRCLYGPRPHVPWNRNGGGRDIERQALESGRTFTCHEWQNACCRGFYNRHRHESLGLQIGEALGAIRWITRSSAARKVRWIRRWMAALANET
jgi:hypothetical protein